MNGHVLRRPFGNEFSSTVLTTGIVLPAVMGDAHDGTPVLSWSVAKAVGASDGSGRSSTMTPTLTASAVTPREQPPGDARWSCH